LPQYTGTQPLQEQHRVHSQRIINENKALTNYIPARQQQQQQQPQYKQTQPRTQVKFQHPTQNPNTMKTSYIAQRPGTAGYQEQHLSEAMPPRTPFNPANFQSPSKNKNYKFLQQKIQQPKISVKQNPLKSNFILPSKNGHMKEQTNKQRYFRSPQHATKTFEEYNNSRRMSNRLEVGSTKITKFDGGMTPSTRQYRQKRMVSENVRKGQYGGQAATRLRGSSGMQNIGSYRHHTNQRLSKKMNRNLNSAGLKNQIANDFLERRDRKRIGGGKSSKDECTLI